MTRPTLPPRAELDAYLDDIYASGWLTNNGPLSRALESGLQARLRAPHLTYVNNGTQALQLALRALGVTGSVITSPFTYVATANAIALEGCRPVFADVDDVTLTLDPDGLERALRPDTTAIVAVPVYGMPCRHDALAAFAKTHSLRLVYDAAHAFGTTLHGRALATFGDAAALSFHATKVFHTVEGGAVVTPHAEVHARLAYLRSHGHAGDDYAMVGPNAKNSEFHAAVGLANLARVDAAIEARRRVYATYAEVLDGSPVRLPNPAAVPGLAYNYAYAPARFPDEAALLRARARLEAANVFPRRYFHPSLATLPQFGSPRDCPRAAHAAATPLCLPLYPDLPLDIAADIGRAVREAAAAPSALAGPSAPAGPGAPAAAPAVAVS